MKEFIIQQVTQTPDEIGGFEETWETFAIVEGYIDLITGTDLNIVQNAFVENSTHVLIIPTYTPGISSDMRIVNDDRYYTITYSDDPVGVGHHNEIYCKFGGVI